METAGELAQNVLSELQPQPQGNSTPLIADVKTNDEFDTRYRKGYAVSVGGLRALDTYTESRFKETPGNRTAFEAAKAFDPSKQTDNLFFCGPTGSGKSHLAVIAARRFLDIHFKVSTITQMTLAREVRNADSAGAEQGIINYYVEQKVLVIDDLGVAKDTEFSLSLLYEIIHGRYMNRPGGLIVTSNLGLGQLAEKIGDDRISSRLAQMCKVFNLASEKDRRVA